VWAVFPVRPSVDLAYWRGFLKASLVLGLGLAISQVYSRIDTVLLALLRPSAEVGLYGADYKFVELAQAVAYAAAISMFPALTAFAAQRDPRLKSLAQKGLEILMAMAVPIAVAMAFAPRTLLELTAGSGFRGAAGALQILAF